MATIPKRKIRLPRNISMLIHGLSDAGKTVLASCSPDLNPKEVQVVSDTIFLDSEGGMISHITQGAGIIVPRYPEDPDALVDSKKTATAAIEYIMANKSWIRNVAFDSLDRFQELELDRSVKEKKHDRPEMQDWGDILQTVERLCRSLPTWGANIVVTCHSADDKDANDKLVKRMPFLRGSIQSKISSYFDVVGYYELTRDDKGQELRRLHVKGSNQSYARSRLGGCLPAVIDNPTIPGIIATYNERRDAIIKRLSGHPNVQILDEPTFLGEQSK